MDENFYDTANTFLKVKLILFPDLKKSLSLVQEFEPRFFFIFKSKMLKNQSLKH